MQPDTQTTRFYESHVRRFGYGYRGLGFGRRSSQEKRFAAAAALGSFHGARLLDVGCGFGDLLAWLNARGVRPRYTGLDLCVPMVERCRRRFPDGDAQFVVGDVLTHEVEEPYDYVVASGIFGYKAPGLRARVQPILEKLYSMAEAGLAVNFLSGCAPRRSGPAPHRFRSLSRGLPFPRGGAIHAQGEVVGQVGVVHAHRRR
ncbi:MAG TPA: class I SAM-dependent methyltransferase, partial [Burkholderiales bacterium]